ncbi:AMP-binding enzyme [Bradyrhizobium sp. CCBAU 25338]|uniref:AMP-binding enzyme n=1 Tax=Bradyrhizobium sp. CCBAU 25338 TaxID=1641877 RepID=UPI002304270D|nr:class I adenylate-forming enzyme family protein [Bradyrhizobium sp. CCBAU 25338]
MGRQNKIVVRAGQHIAPVEVENALIAASPAVLRAAVVGLPDGAMGHRVVGFLQLAYWQSEELLVFILSTIANNLADYKVPERLIVIDALPLDALGNVDREALAHIALEDNSTGLYAINKSSRSRPSSYRKGSHFLPRSQQPPRRA